MARCSHCTEALPFGEWWCPGCGWRSDYAPRGAARRRPPDLLEAIKIDPGGLEPDALAAGRGDSWQAEYLVQLKRRRLVKRLLGTAGALVVAGLVALGITVLPGKSPAVVVQLTFTRSPYGLTFNSPPLAEVAIGHNPPVPMIVDTGSVGVRVFADAIGTAHRDGVDSTFRQDTVEFADGSVWQGHVASATVGLGTVITKQPVPIELVDTVICKAKVACPYPGGIADLEQSGIDGILGIGLDGPAPGDPTNNPILELPGRSGRVWTIDMASPAVTASSSGRLILDAPPLTSPVAHIQLAHEGSAGTSSRYWDDAPNLCWTFGTALQCDPTVFDSGAALMFVGRNAIHRQPTAQLLGDGPPILPASVPIAVMLPGHTSPLWAFDSGGDPGESAVAVLPGNQPVINTGVQAFFNLEIQYDESNGTITIANPAS